MEKDKKDTGKNLNLSVDYEDLERRDLLSGEPRYLEDEIRNTRFAMIFGALAVVFLIITVIMTWVLYSRERTRTFLWHAIFLSVALLVACLCAAWGAMSGSSIKVGRPPSTFLTGLVFILSAIFAVYLFVESIWLVLYRPVHFNYLVGLKTNNELWDSRMIDGTSLQQGWKTDRRMMWWIVFFDIATALCFTYCAYAARSVVVSRYNLTKLLLWTALVWACWSCFMVVYWVEESYEYQRAQPGITTYQQLYLIKVIAIIILVLIVLNAIIAILQNRIGFFVISALEVIALLILISAAGILLRQARNAAFAEQEINQGCIPTMTTVHENDVNSWCITGGKYLAAGTQCSKSYMVTRWEGNNEQRALNPSCCGMAKFFYLYPFMLTGYWSLYVAICLGIAIACNIYLGDANEYLSTSHTSRGLIDYIGFALIVLIIIGWCIYFLARRKNSLANATNTYKNSYIDPLNNQVDQFTMVPPTVLSNIKRTQDDVNGDGCYAYDPATHPVPTFSTDANAGCTDTNTCYERVALLISGGKLKVFAHPKDEGAVQGSVLGRQNFFPGCTDNTADYSLYYGTKSQISSHFAKLRVCPQVEGTNPSFLLVQDQVKKTDVNETGLTSTESNTQPALSAFNQATCDDGFSTVAAGSDQSKACSGKCKIKFDSKPDSILYNLKGKLFYQDGGASKTDIHPQLTVEAYKADRKVGGTFTLFENGLYSIADIPMYKGTSYILTLKTKDSTGRFQDKVVDILVDKDTGASTEVPAGSIRLTTKDGSVCPAGDTACINKQTLQFGKIVVSTQDSSNANTTVTAVPAGGFKVTALRGQTLRGLNAGQVETANDGRATLSNIPFGSYLLMSNKTGFIPEILPVDLQEATLAPRPFIMKPVDEDNDMRVSTYFNEPNADFDLLLAMNSDKGGSCTVSPTNKYCPYTADLNDVSFGVGEETVAIKRLSVANYMAYVSPAPTYSTTCQGSEDYERNALSYHQAASWNWDSFKSSNPLSSLDISSFTNGKGAELIKDVYGYAIGLLGKSKSVETQAQADVVKRIIGLNGNNVTSQKKTSTTSFKSYEQIGGDSGIFGWPESKCNWKNTTVTNTSDLVQNVGFNTTVKVLVLTSNCTDPFNLTTEYNKTDKISVYDNGTRATLSDTNTTTGTKDNSTYVRIRAFNFDQVGLAGELNATDRNFSKITNFTNNTIIQEGQLSVVITRPTGNVAGNESLDTTSWDLTNPNSTAKNYRQSTVKTVSDGTSSTDQRTERQIISESTQGGNQIKTEDNTTTRIKTESSNSTKRQDTVQTTTVTTTYANETVEVHTTTKTLIVYNLGRTDQATKKSQSDVITQTPKGGSTTVIHSHNSDFAPARRILATSHFAASPDANHILVSCFSGFGAVSTVNVNEPQVDQPSMSQCIEKIKTLKGDFTVEKLRSTVDSWLKNNPQYQS